MVSVRVAPGTNAPVGSATVPWMDVRYCACAGTTRSSSSSATNQPMITGSGERLCPRRDGTRTKSVACIVDSSIKQLRSRGDVSVFRGVPGKIAWIAQSIAQRDSVITREIGLSTSFLCSSRAGGKANPRAKRSGRLRKPALQLGNCGASSKSACGPDCNPAGWRKTLPGCSLPPTMFNSAIQHSRTNQLSNAAIAALSLPASHAEFTSVSAWAI